MLGIWRICITTDVSHAVVFMMNPTREAQRKHEKTSTRVNWLDRGCGLASSMTLQWTEAYSAQITTRVLTCRETSNPGAITVGGHWRLWKRTIQVRASFESGANSEKKERMGYKRRVNLRLAISNTVTFVNSHQSWERFRAPLVNAAGHGPVWLTC